MNDYLHTFASYDLGILGAGAAGFFAAIQIKIIAPHLKVAVLEAGTKPLQKLKISGGGRCNVTHHCLEVRDLVRHYPRGAKEILGAFMRFGPQQTIDFFEGHGVSLKTEEDGRMFPTTDSSQTIIDLFMKLRAELDIDLRLNEAVLTWTQDDSGFNVSTSTQHYHCRALLVSTGSDQKQWSILEGMGIPLVSPVPSLFSFKTETDFFRSMPGISVQDCRVKWSQNKYESQGPLLFTHTGISGPCVLKLSAFAAREFAKNDYEAELVLDFLPSISNQRCLEIFHEIKQQNGAKKLININPFGEILVQRFWQEMLRQLDLSEKRWADLSKADVETLVAHLKQMSFQMKGRATHKAEFVTAGGVDLKSVDFRSMQSRIVSGLFFAGEVLNIDGVTGGFNFQAAWTTATIAAAGITDFLLVER
jgi:predicted Rossmann fold flavoprotein